MKQLKRMAILAKGDDRKKEHKSAKPVGMQTTKELWTVVIAGTVLTLNSGVINGIIGGSYINQTVTHVSGTTTRLGIALGPGHDGTLRHQAGLVFFFILGGFLSGLINGHVSFKLGRRYGLCLILESTLILMAWAMLIDTERGPEEDPKDFAVRDSGLMMLALAAGVQNGMGALFSGAIIRTTHVTGTATDMGMLIGTWAHTKLCYRGATDPEKQKRKAPMWKLRIYIPLYLGFLFGSCFGYLMWRDIGFHALLIPAFFCGLVGLAYLLYRVIVLNELKRLTKLDLKAAPRVLKGIILTPLAEPSVAPFDDVPPLEDAKTGPEEKEDSTNGIDISLKPQNVPDSSDDYVMDVRERSPNAPSPAVDNVDNNSSHGNSAGGRENSDNFDVDRASSDLVILENRT